jgi:hypothetical protein
MDSNPQLAKPISDDQELTKVLAGVNHQADEAVQFGTVPVVAPTTLPTPSAPITNPVDLSTNQHEVTASELPVADVTPGVSPIVGYNPPMSAVAETPTAMPTGTDLSDIKKEALHDLRPLVDKLDIAPDEKFDTYLLLIRSTDDKALIAPAYAAAQSITDETRRAQALLDVIKEIDYLSNPPQ